MVKPLGGSPPKPATHESNVENTNLNTQQTQISAPQTSASQTPVVHPSRYGAEAQSARRAEHSFSGQARAAELLSETPSKMPGGADGTGNSSQSIVKGDPSAGNMASGQAARRDLRTLEGDTNFRSLNAETQTRVRDLMMQQEHRTSRRNLTTLSTDPDFARLSPDGQNRALQRFASNPANPANTQSILDTVRSRANLEQNSNFQHLNESTRRQVLTQLESYHGNPIAQRNLSDLAIDPNFSRISPTHQDQTLQALNRNPGDGVYTQNLRDITGSENFRGMNDANKSQILNMAAQHSNNQRYQSDLYRLVNDNRFERLSSRDQGMTLNVFENTTPNGRQALHNLLQRDINGQTALTSRGFAPHSGTLIETLSRLSTTPLNSRLQDSAGNPIPRERVTAQLLQELNNPDRYINQGNRHDTCTVANMTNRVANESPAEYARLVSDLAITGESRLANGDRISVPGRDAWQPDNSNRSHGERILQSALMSYSRPGERYYNLWAGKDGLPGTNDDGFQDRWNPNVQPVTVDGFVDTQRSALDTDADQRVLNGLYGRNFEIFSSSSGEDMVDRTREELRSGRGPIDVTLTWDTARNVGHRVQVREIQNGRVYFYNPWGGGAVGATGDEHGTSLRNKTSGPVRRTEDGGRAIESMTVEEFQHSVVFLFVPEGR